MNDTIWVGLIHVQPGPEATEGAFAYCAARAETVVAAIVAIGAEASECGFEILDIDWLSRYSELSESRRGSDGVTGVLAALGSGDAAFDRFYTYLEKDTSDAADAAKERVLKFVEGWIDGALEDCDPFEFGDVAFAAEMWFPGDDAAELGWAYQGALEDAPALFSRAAEAAADDGEPD